MAQGTTYDQQRRRMEDEIRKQIDAIKKPNILIVGHTGAGKSSLINAIVGEKIAQTGAGRPITQSYSLYQHPLLNLYDSMGWEGGAEGDQRFRKDTQDFIQAHRTTDPNEHVHIVWYVISAAEARFQEYDAQLVRDAFAGLPVLFVLTKCDVARDDQIESVERVIRAATMQIAQQATRDKPAPRIVGIVRTAADPIPVLRQQPWGMGAVVEATSATLPELQRFAFDSAQMVDFGLKAKRARAIILAAASGAGAVGLVPIPFSDSVLLTPIQITMVSSIAIVYGFSTDPGSLTALIGGAIAPLAAESVGVTLVGNIFKFVPVAGSMVGGMIEGTVASTITATIGFAFQRAFHEIALRRARGELDSSLSSISQYLQQALPQVLQQIRQRGVDN
ncbi:MAG TPA: DUF697 domain-containing protein, partial [Ktedonobacterales bacterium]|nr:DUF697 domain-containing protein [Ktedonobacterales bacterium]